MGSAPRNQQGVASGMLATARVVGQALSVAVAGAVFASFGGAAAASALVRQRGSLPAGQTAALQSTFVSGLHAAFIVCALLAAIGIVTAVSRGREVA